MIVPPFKLRYEYLKDIDWKDFKNPPKSARPLVRWWWTGLDVEKEELIREVKELDEANFLGAEIQVFMIGSPIDLKKKDPERAARSHRFMQPYYYEMVKEVLEEASKRSMIMDVTIGSSWPAGGTHVSKEDSMKILMIGQKVVNGPTSYSDIVPKHTPPLNLGLIPNKDFNEDLKLVAVIAAKPIGKPGKINYNRLRTSYIDKDTLVDLTDNVNDNILKWDVPEGTWQIFSFFSAPSGVTPILDSRSSSEESSLVLDHLSSDSIRKHLDLHLGEGKRYFGSHFGKTLRAFFTDSLELASNWLWTSDFLEKFRTLRGYDLKPFLPICCVPNRDNKYYQLRFGKDVPCFDFVGDVGDKIRYDYEMTISDLFSGEFVQTMTEWAEENELQNRIQAYGIRADTLKCYRIAHIPETEQLYAGGIMDFLKLAGSAGLVYEKPIITAESIVWNQRDYMTTPLKWKVAADRLFISGVNQMIYHGFPYQNPSFSYPGFCGFSTPYLPYFTNFSSNFGRMNPFWEYFPIMNEYVSRCQYILQHGKTMSNVAIFYPLFNYCNSVLKKEELVAGYLDEYDEPPSKNVSNAHVKDNNKLDYNEKWTSSLIKLTDDLISNGFFYAHLNEESILNSETEGKKLKIGVAQFEVLILQNIDKISLKMTEKLNQIAETEIPIVFVNQLPIQQPGFFDYEKNDAKIKTIMNKLLDGGKIHLIKDDQDLSHFMRNELNIIPGLVYEEPQPLIHYIHKKTENSDYYFLRNSCNKPKKITAKFLHPDKIPFVLNPWDGEINQAGQYEKEKNYIKMDIFFKPYGSVILEFKKETEKLHVIKSPLQIKRINGELVSHVNNSGKYSFKLSNGTVKETTIPSETFLSIPLRNWHFKTTLRDHEGNLTPIEMDMEELKDWREIPELKYCSSKGIYSTNFRIKEEILQDDLKLFLSLERAHDVAFVIINGKQMPPLLITPYEIEITPHVKNGDNNIEIEITPTLRNRLLGYGKTGGLNWQNHKGKKELMPSGLISPVSIKTVKELRLTD